MINPEVLMLPGNTELIALEETSNSIKTLETLMTYLSAQMMQQHILNVVLSSSVLREDIISNDFDESIINIK